MTVQAGNIVKAVVNITLPDLVIAQNVYHYKADTGVSDTDANTIGAIEDSLVLAYNHISGRVDSGVSYGDIEVSISTDNGATFFDIGSQSFGANAPSAAGDHLPHGIAALVSFSGIGTGYQGKKYIPGLTEGFSDGSTWSAATITDLVSYATAANDNITVAGGVLLFGWLRKTPLSFIEHSGTVTVATLPAYQRRRKPGVGI